MSEQFAITLGSIFLLGLLIGFIVGFFFGILNDVDTRGEGDDS